MRQRKDFLWLRADKRVIKEKDLLLFYHTNKLHYARFAFSISKRIGKAVYRNRLKRIMREYIRQHYLPGSHYDFLLKVKRPPQSRRSLTTQLHRCLVRMKHEVRPH